MKEIFLTTYQDVLGAKRTKMKEWISQRPLDVKAERKAKKEVINASRARCSMERD